MIGINHIKYLSQQDPQWKDLPMSGTTLTIGNDGCAMTCMSMLTDFYGCYQTPAQLAQSPVYDKGGQAQWLNMDFPTFCFRYADSNQFGAFTPDMGLLNAYLDNGHGDPDKACLICITITPYRGGTPYTHFLLGLWPLPETKDIYVIDPWDAKSKPLFLSYPSAKITEVVYFTKWDKTQHGGKLAWQGQGEPVAPLYN